MKRLLGRSLVQINLVRECPKEDRPTISTPGDVMGLMRPQLADRTTEEFWVLCLDARNKLCGSKMVAKGTLNATIVHPREVFKPAIMTNAASVILVHNHPSGDTSPSSDDTTLTVRLVKAGEILGIDVLDHVIVGHNNYYSLKEANLMQETKETASSYSPA